MKNFNLFWVLFFASFLISYAEDAYVPSIDWHGYVKTDIIYDTRQVNAIREGHFHIMPLDEKLDSNGNDLNATPSFNILSIQTRLNGKIKGPEVSGIKTSGFIEGAFFGSAEGNINTFRLRHAFVDLDWGTGVLRVGQFWHPMFIVQCFPDVVNFNTGVPFQPFSRNPQVRLTQKFGDFSVSVTALSQRDFVSYGPAWNGTSYSSTSGSQFLRNSSIPEIDLQLMYSSKNFLIGATGTYKTLRPEINSPKGYINENTISSFATQGFMKLSFEPITIKLEGIYGQNLADLLLLGGYAAYDWDETTGITQYTNNNIISAWGEITFKVSDNLSLNVFSGYTKNLGFDENLKQIGSNYAVFSRAPNADNVLRVSPYFRWDIGKVQIAGELEYTSVAYGKPNYVDDKGKVSDTHTVSNLRSLIGVYIYF